MWDKISTNKLISYMHKYPALWDRQCEGFKNKLGKECLLEEVALIFDTTIQNIRKKLYSLISRYNTESRKMTNCDTNSSWLYFTKMRFMSRSSLYEGQRTPKTNARKDAGESSHQQQSPKDKISRKRKLPENVEDESRVAANTRARMKSQPSTTGTKTASRTQRRNNSNISDSERTFQSISTNDNTTLPSDINHDIDNSTPNTSAYEDAAQIGRFVETEVKKIISDVRRRLLRREIQRIVYDIGRADDKEFYNRLLNVISE